MRSEINRRFMNHEYNNKIDLHSTWVRARNPQFQSHRSHSFKSYFACSICCFIEWITHVAHLIAINYAVVEHLDIDRTSMFPAQSESDNPHKVRFSYAEQCSCAFVYILHFAFCLPFSFKLIYYSAQQAIFAELVDVYHVWTLHTVNDDNNNKIVINIKCINKQLLFARRATFTALLLFWLDFIYFSYLNGHLLVTWSRVCSARHRPRWRNKKNYLKMKSNFSTRK